MIKQSKRQRQVGELVRRNLGIVFQQEGSYIYGDALVTVTNVIVAPDLQQAKVYLSVYNTENKQSVILQVEAHTSRLRQSLAYRIAKHIRRIPKIAFYIDETLDEMYHVDGLFKRLEDDNQMGRDQHEGEEKDDAE